MEVSASYMTPLTASKEFLQYLLDAGEVQFPAEVKWGKGYRNVAMFKGKQFQYKGTGKITVIEDDRKTFCNYI